MTDLFAEFTAAAGKLKGQHVARLEAAGVPRSVVYGGPMLCGAMPISTSSAGLYEPAEEGRAAVIVPMGQRFTPWCGWEVVDDLCAFFIDQPGRWWLRRGAEAVLGLEALEDAHSTKAAPQLVATPFDWLKAGGKAVCIVNWGACDPRELFVGFPVVNCASPALERRLLQRIEELARPSFEIRAEGVQHAAA